jgi:hypothetical protein
MGETLKKSIVMLKGLSADLNPAGALWYGGFQVSVYGMGMSGPAAVCAV